MTALAIMDLYPEILDPEFDPKKKKQKVERRPTDPLELLCSLP